MKHAHKYKFDCLEENGHKHRLMGCTEYSLYLGFTHIHLYSGVCSYNGHIHSFTGFSGMPKKTRNGHCHKLSGYLQLSESHKHYYSCYTDENIEYDKTASLIRPVGLK